MVPSNLFFCNMAFQILIKQLLLCFVELFTEEVDHVLVESLHWTNKLFLGIAKHDVIRIEAETISADFRRLCKPWSIYTPFFLSLFHPMK